MRLGVIGLASLVSVSASAGPVPLALDVSGNIAVVTDRSHGVFHFSEADLKALPQHTIETSTNWTEKEAWQGPRLSDVLKRVGARGTSIKVFAYDDFRQVIPMSLIDRYQPILAYKANGMKLDLGTFGPLFVVFPRDQYPSELNGVESQRRFVFQVRRIEVER